MTDICPFNDNKFSAYCRKAEVAPPYFHVKKIFGNKMNYTIKIQKVNTKIHKEILTVSHIVILIFIKAKKQ